MPKSQKTLSKEKEKAAEEAKRVADRWQLEVDSESRALYKACFTRNRDSYLKLAADILES